MVVMHAWYVYRQGQSILGEILVISGACANLIDRVIYGAVIDFIYLHIDSWSWPIFNIADVSVIIGVAFMIKRMFIHDAFRENS